MNQKKNKIIFISTLTYKRDFNEFEYNPESDEFYKFGMAPYIFGDIAKTNKNILIETWRADINALSSGFRKIDKTYIARVFRAKFLFKGYLQSKELFKALKTESKEDNIIFFVGMHDLFLSRVAFKFRKLPLLSIQIGGPDPFWKYAQTKKIKSLITGILELYFSTKNHDFYFISNDREEEYLSRKISPKKLIRQPLINANLDRFYPIDKLEAKKALDLPLDKKIILAIGRLFYNAGVQHIIDILEDLKQKNYFVLWVGIDFSEGDLMERIKKSGIRYEGRIWNPELIKYYNASDIYLYTPFDEEALNFGGTGYQSIESLACGTPVVSSTMHVFPGKVNKRACKIPKKPDDIIPMIEEVFNNYPTIDECKEMVCEIYKKENIDAYQMKIYSELFMKYYKKQI